MITQLKMLNFLSQLGCQPVRGISLPYSASPIASPWVDQRFSVNRGLAFHNNSLNERQGGKWVCPGVWGLGEGSGRDVPGSQTWYSGEDATDIPIGLSGS
jgi:hypothetical protein